MEDYSNNNSYQMNIKVLPVITSNPFDLSSYLSLSALEPLSTERGQDFCDEVGFCGYVPLNEHPDMN